MPYPNILQRPTILVSEDVVQLIQRIHSFHDMPKYCVLPIQVVDPIRERNEELRATSALLPLECRSNRHGHSAFVCMLEMRNHLRREVPLGLGFRSLALALAGNVGPNGFTARPSGSWVARLCEKVFGNCKKVS